MTDDYEADGNLTRASILLDDALVSDFVHQDQETLVRRARAEIDAWLEKKDVEP